MDKTRLEIFSDAVIAIAMTLMVLELKVPHGASWAALTPLWPTFLAYVMSYVYLSIYWNNHHHMLHATDHIDGRIMWANLHLLFWLSLIPFATAWLAENNFAQVPTAVYGAVLLLAAIAYSILFKAIVAHSDANQDLREAVGDDRKGRMSIVFYVIALPLCMFSQWVALGLYVLAALIWLVPDKRIESRFGHRHHH